MQTHGRLSVGLIHLPTLVRILIDRLQVGLRLVESSAKQNSRIGGRFDNLRLMMLSSQVSRVSLSKQSEFSCAQGTY
jgi:hypothetical protein